MVVQKLLGPMHLKRLCGLYIPKSRAVPLTAEVLPGMLEKVRWQFKDKALHS